jgi:hypothetical protein
VITFGAWVRRAPIFVERYMPLFEVALVEKPTKKEQEDGTGREKLVFGPEPVIAPNKESAAIALMRGGKVPEFDVQRTEVLVRPFA